MNIRQLIGLGALSATLLTGAARAQTTPFYAGANFSWSLVDPSPALLGAKGLESADFNKDAPTGYKIYGGYQLNPTWGLELSYADFGGTPIRGFVTVPNPTTGLLEPTTVNGRADLTSFALQATATIPFAEGVTVIFRGGAHFWNMDQSAGTAPAALTGTPPALPTGFRLPVAISGSDDGVDLVFGASLLFEFHPRWATRLDVEKYLGDNDALSFGFGFQFKF